MLIPGRLSYMPYLIYWAFTLTFFKNVHQNSHDNFFYDLVEEILHWVYTFRSMHYVPIEFTATGGVIF